jgi:hypothetical protein
LDGEYFTKTELNSSLLKHREFLFTGREHSAQVMKMNQETGVMEGVKKKTRSC